MRRLTVLLAVAMVLPACAEEQVQPSIRARLAEPMVALALTLERAEGMADSARYRVERGEPMREAFALLRGTLDELRAHAGELAHAAIGVEDPQAAAIARQSVELALEAADATDVEVSTLTPLVDADALMGRVVATWAATPDAALAAGLPPLAEAIAAARAEPEACRALWDNRRRWALLVADRTARLAAQPDERDAFLANPFGEDRRAADASDRHCWRAHGALPLAMADIRPLAARLHELTSESPDSQAGEAGQAGEPRQAG